MDDHVIKSCKPTNQEIYDLLSGEEQKLRNAVKFNVVKRSSEDHDRVLLEIRPVCLQILPDNIDDLCNAIRCVLTALEDLHSHGFVHRDVRWPNVLKHGDTWLLADFELVGGAGDKFPGNLQVKCLPPEYSEAGFTSKGDVYSVGILVKEWMKSKKYSVQGGVSAWLDRILSSTPDSRPEAKDLLAESQGWLFTSRAA